MLRALDYNFVLSHKRGKQEESNIKNFSFTFLVYVTQGKTKMDATTK